MPTPSTINQVITNLRQGALTSAELMEATYERLNRLRHLNAFTFLQSRRQLLNQVSLLERRPEAPDLPLRGIPVVIKDNFCVRGMPATCGSKMLQNFRPPYTATVVQKLIDAGVIILGKSNMDEFGMGCGTSDSVFGPTKNVWGLEKFRCGEGECAYSDWHIPGGSSGGSAVAVAAGICFAALGSDTGGSTRNPASYCGVVGLKPTYGLLSRYGLIPLVNSMDVPGILTRTVEDCATILNIVQGFDENDSTSFELDLPPVEINPEPSVSKLRIGISDDFICEGMDPEVIECWRDTAAMLEKAGALVSKTSLPHTKYSIACYSVLNSCEVASNMARYDGLRFGHRSPNPAVNSTEGLYAQTRHEGFNDVVRGRILAGNFFLLKANYEKYFKQAMKIRRLITNDFDKVWNEGYDLLLTPVTLTAAPTYCEYRRLDNRTQSSIQDYCTQSTNMAGGPALSLPIKLNSAGLPLSLQLIGPKFSESKLLNAGKFIEESVGFPPWDMKGN